MNWIQGIKRIGVLAALSTAPFFAQESSDPLDRTVLPIPEPKPPTYTALDEHDVKPPPRFEVKAPAGAPNVLVILVDDLGFAGTSTFGGPVATPTFDRLASEGLHYNSFHTTAVCSPTRAALKSGRNHHVCNMGGIIETGTAFPGNTGQIPNSVAPVAEMLRLNGYSTGAFGKWHELAAWEASVSGPLDRWPIHQGFDKFYGFLGGETNQWAPYIYDGVHPVELPDDPDYHFLTDMTDQAAAWIRYQKALTPHKPFFVYFAPGATHAPHHVPGEWIARWNGKFDQGWDVLREETLARQIERGTVPEGTPLAPKPEAIPDWDELSADEQRLFSRQAEVEIPEGGANGAILVQGGRFGGWALYVHDGVPAYDYNFLGLQRFTITATEPLVPGQTAIRFEFDYDGGGLAKGGAGTLYVNDEQVAQGRIERAQPMIFSADETADVGIDLATPVVEAIGSEARSRFTGRIPRVTIEAR